MSRGETPQHARLKSLALSWARANGYAVAAREVRVPRSGFRADVAACASEVDGATALFECKQARADLLKDAHDEQRARSTVAELAERRRVLESLLAVHFPELRCGEALWPEFDRWDFSGLEHRTYRAVRASLTRWQRRVREGTKFSRMGRYRCADRLYLVVEDEIAAPAEIPAQWGLLVRRGDELVCGRLPAVLQPTDEQRNALRLSIARTIAALGALAEEQA